MPLLHTGGSASGSECGELGELSPMLGSVSGVSFNDPFVYRWRKRTAVLIALLVFQSCSSFILAHFEQLLQKHSVVVFFLTMLVGAGGNAGNQAAVLVIRGLATGEITARSYTRYVLGEMWMAIAISVPMVVAGYLRVRGEANTPACCCARRPRAATRQASAALTPARSLSTPASRSPHPFVFCFVGDRCRSSTVRVQLTPSPSPCPCLPSSSPLCSLAAYCR